MLGILLAAGTILGHGVALDSRWTFEAGGGLVGGFVQASRAIGEHSEVRYALDVRLESNGQGESCGTPASLYAGAWATWASSSGAGPLQVTVRGGPGLQVNAGRGRGTWRSLGIPGACATMVVPPWGEVVDVNGALLGRLDLAFGGDHVRLGPFAEAVVRETFPPRESVGFDLMFGLRAAGGGESFALAAEAGLGGSGWASGGLLPRLMFAVSFR